MYLTQTKRNLQRKSCYLARGLGEGLRAPLGLGLISGAEVDDDVNDDGAEPRSALLRTAGPHRRRKASVSPLGHSHHWFICKQTPPGGGRNRVRVYSKWITRLRLRLTQTGLCAETRVELCPSRCFAWRLDGGSGRGGEGGAGRSRLPSDDQGKVLCSLLTDALRSQCESCGSHLCTITRI